jgi:hypothetical protein
MLFNRIGVGWESLALGTGASVSTDPFQRLRNLPRVGPVEYAIGM